MWRLHPREVVRIHFARGLNRDAPVSMSQWAASDDCLSDQSEEPEPCSGCRDIP